MSEVAALASEPRVAPGRRRSFGTVRIWHAYLSLLTGPSIIFFALTGAVQIFGWHEVRGDYQPPRVVAELGMLHKKQVWAEPRRRPRPAETPGVPAAPPPAAPALATELLKWAFLVVALGLAASAALGLYIGVTHVRYRRTAWVLSGFGVLIPVALVLAAAA